MIAYLDGHLVEKTLIRVVIDVNGVGFELSIPVSTYDKLPPVGEKLTLKVYLHFRQEILQLFGFYTDAEKALFQLLISSVSGIGPRLALNVLSSMPINTFCAAISNNDIKVLSSINGIGKRSAERLVIELKDKIQDIAPEAFIAEQQPSLSPEKARSVEDAISALITLGFKPEAARKTVRTLCKDLEESDIKPQLLIRRALVVLNN